ncbi:hypothetical protein [Parvularcula sp. IMCC14364]|uniref:hypothetical protein n=1 Tax=Parvularcula sp. IMCC14364 TaxID=3067902 RepID=UPI0027408551|nr:hypothetical protein [Parvularcula sp. IMCC14364]
MPSQFIVRQSKTFFYFSLALISYFLWRVTNAAYFTFGSASEPKDWALFVLFISTAVISIYALFYYMRRMKARPPIAIFDAEGITTEAGERISWDDITKVYTWTGVLFVKDHTNYDWVVRLDPAEIGFKKMRKLKSFLRQIAPRHLVIELE